MKLLGPVLGMYISPSLLDPISKGTQWLLPLILITSKVCQVKSYRWEFSHFVFLVFIILCNGD